MPVNMAGEAVRVVSALSDDKRKLREALSSTLTMLRARSLSAEDMKVVAFAEKVLADTLVTR